MRRWLGSALGLGFLPRAPGTWGSLGTVLVAAAVVGVEGLWPGWVTFAGPIGTRPGFLVTVAAILGLGVVLGQSARRDWGVEDPGGFVVDEVVGQLLALAPAAGPFGLVELVVAFAAFRLFDITKPPPCRRVEAWHGGVGIMADDVVAGVYAALVTAAVVRWW